MRYVETTCLYCDNWILSSVILREAPDEDSSGGKKKSKPSSGSVRRKCHVRQKTITSHEPACKYFKPARNIYCNKHSERIPMVLCLHRRINHSKFIVYKKCKKCRQFAREIQPVLEEYHIGGTRILEPKVGRILKRRKKSPREEVRTLKRRNRNPKVTPTIPIKPPRKLKRKIKKITEVKSPRKLKRRTR
jgi:hypothetical protein